MATCKKCGKRGLFLKLNNFKICAECEKHEADNFSKAYMTDDAPVTRAHAWYKPEIEFTLKGFYQRIKPKKARPQYLPLF